MSFYRVTFRLHKFLSAFSALTVLFLALSACSNPAGTGNNDSAQWGTWFDSTVVTAQTPISLSYDRASDTAAITVSSISGATSKYSINAYYHLGAEQTGWYTISFTAWTDSSSYPVYVNLGEDYGSYDNFPGMDEVLTTSPTVYNVGVNVSSAGKVKANFFCAAQAGTFHVSNVTISAASASTLSQPADLSATYIPATGETTILFSPVTGADYVYLYENATDDPSTAMLLSAYDISKSICSTGLGPTRLAWWIGLSSSSPDFAVALYDAPGTYYYWVSARKTGQYESTRSRISATVTGDFSNFSSILSGYPYIFAVPDQSSQYNWGFDETASSTGTVNSRAFYAKSGTTLQISPYGPSLGTAGMRVYFAGTAGSGYLLGSPTGWNTEWKDTPAHLTFPNDGYYIIDWKAVVTGEYNFQLIFE